MTVLLNYRSRRLKDRHLIQLHFTEIFPSLQAFFKLTLKLAPLSYALAGVERNYINGGINFQGLLCRLTERKAKVMTAEGHGTVI
jgi:hypothetical protein